MTMSPAKRFVATRVFPGFVVLVGAGASYLGCETMRLARESQEWPAVDGRVIRTSVLTESGATQPGGGQRSVTYRPVVVYEYTVDGVRHEGERISFGEYATADVADANKVVTTYPQGRSVRVHYRPGDHAVAVLEPGTEGVPWFFLALGLVFVAVGLVLATVLPLLVGLRRRP